MRLDCSKSIEGKTKNGLQYHILPQKDFGEKMAAIVVKRGANHLFWKGKNGEKTEFPQGTAHAESYQTGDSPGPQYPLP